MFTLKTARPFDITVINTNFCSFLPPTYTMEVTDNIFKISNIEKLNNRNITTFQYIFGRWTTLDKNPNTLRYKTERKLSQMLFSFLIHFRVSIVPQILLRHSTTKRNLNDFYTGGAKRTNLIKPKFSLVEHFKPKCVKITT